VGSNSSGSPQIVMAPGVLYTPDTFFNYAMVMMHTGGNTMRVTGHHFTGGSWTQIALFDLFRFNPGMFTTVSVKVASDSPQGSGRSQRFDGIGVLPYDGLGLDPEPTPTPPPPGSIENIDEFSALFLPGEGMGFWNFSPTGPGTVISTDEHPGLLTVLYGNPGAAIKGTVGQPISLFSYPPPWEFELDVMQSFWTVTRFDQINVAAGIHVEVTYTDDTTESFDVYNVHMRSRF
jgi:hypothetical protein